MDVVSSYHTPPIGGRWRIFGWKRTLCLWAIITTIASASAQQLTPMSRAALDSLVYPPLMKGAEQVLQFKHSTAHIGTVSETHPEISLSYPFCNVSTDTVHITHVRTLCGCTRTDAATQHIPPGATDSIIIRFLPLGHPGKVHQRAYVYTTLGKQPVACLEIVGQVNGIN